MLAIFTEAVETFQVLRLVGRTNSANNLFIVFNHKWYIKLLSVVLTSKLAVLYFPMRGIRRS